MTFSLNDVKEIESKIVNGSAESVNDIVDLVEVCEKGAKEPEAVDPEVLHAALVASKRAFVHLASNLKSKATKRVHSGAANDESFEKLKVYAEWLRTKYTWYTSVLLSLLGHAEYGISSVSLGIVMELVLVEGKQGKALFLKPGAIHAPSFQTGLFNLVVDALVQKSRLLANNMSAMSFFAEEYLNYDDVRFLTLMAVNKSLKKKTPTADGVNNLHILISNVAMPATVSDIDDFYVVAPPESEENKDEGTKSRKRKRGDGTSSRWKPLIRDLKEQRRLFSEAWRRFLSLPLTPAIYKDVLVRLHVDVMPHLVDPRMLLDFLTESYDTGGVVSLLALNGLFILMTKHNLEYPKFYEKLYALFDSSLFHAKYRARFFRLAALFLRSRMLPSTTVAAFIKRLARLALSAPPSGCLVVIPFVYNLMLAHPACATLVHAPAAFQSPFATKEAKQAVQQLGGADVYDMNEPNPELSRAAESSLWEIQVLQHHYCPSVSKMAKILENPVNKKVKYNLDEFVDATYQSLFDSEVKRRTKQVPMAYEVATSLFGPAFDAEEWLLPETAAAEAVPVGQ